MKRAFQGLVLLLVMGCASATSQTGHVGGPTVGTVSVLVHFNGLGSARIYYGDGESPIRSAGWVMSRKPACLTLRGVGDGNYMLAVYSLRVWNFAPIERLSSRSGWVWTIDSMTSRAGALSLVPADEPCNNRKV